MLLECKLGGGQGRLYYERVGEREIKARNGYTSQTQAQVNF